ncbi:hypothetical protein ACFFIF_01820 [Vagococcus entomophilus]|uniref:Uncharacterized protein n=1 Tax=Vagococcus entomophilus TaxID=1160095 RepID=A0A430AK26_9ENTE|nr:hypothetical protein [Vagococcus entomophilus]RSU08461.1 hypothetical protein CBF30_04270 [Vagococcus entomophilus]
MNNRQRLIDKLSGSNELKFFLLKKGAHFRHKTGNYKTLGKGELIVVVRQTKNDFIGYSASLYGPLMIDCYYRKKDCFELSAKEIKKAFLDIPPHCETDYYRFFGKKAIKNKNGRRYFMQKDPFVLIKAANVEEALKVFSSDISNELEDCRLFEINKQEAWNKYKNTVSENGEEINKNELLESLESDCNELLACSEDLI